MKHGGDRRPGVLDVQVDVPGSERSIADERATEIELARDRNALGLDRLREQLPEHHLFGEVLGTDDDRRRGARGRRPCQRADQRDPRGCDGSGPPGRRPPATHPALQPCEPPVSEERERRRRDRARENRRAVHHRQPAKDVFAQSARADCGGDCRRPHADHRGDPEPRQHRRHGKRELDHEKQLPRGIDHGPIEALKATDRRSNDRQKRVHGQRDERRARPDAADERQRKEKPEQREAGDRLRDVGHQQQRAAEPRTMHGNDAGGNAEECGNGGRESHQHHVLRDQPRQLPGVRPPEMPERAHDRALPSGGPLSVSSRSLTRGSLDRATTAGASQTTSAPASTTPIRPASAKASAMSCVTRMTVVES